VPHAPRHVGPTAPADYIPVRRSPREVAPLPRPVKIAPSILSADFAAMGAAVEAAEKGGADLIHIDIMDGHFVPNLTMGPAMVAALRGHTKLPFDCHLMIEDPDAFIPLFAKAGANHITVHAEACTHLHRTVALIHDNGLKAGVALNPHSPLGNAEVIAQDADMLLLMTVNPGFGGQKFVRSVIPKFEAAEAMRKSRGLAFDIEADGGITVETAPLAAMAGANILVAGNAVYNERPVADNIRAIRAAASGPYGSR
jgi:ribulose-phosphate 3-epimerase